MSDENEAEETEERETPTVFTSLIHSEYGVWAKNFQTVIQLLTLAAIFWTAILTNRNFNGNPNSGGRQVLCAIATDDALANKAVMAVVKENCPGALLP